MKKIAYLIFIFFVLSLCVFVSLGCKPCEHLNVDNGRCLTCGEEVDDPSILYNVTLDGTAEVLGVVGKKEHLVISDNYQGIPVSSIADNAFDNYNELKSVKLPESIKKIGKNAFSGCDSLINVSLPKSLEIIEEQAFFSCINLGNLKLFENVSRIGNCAFAQCINLEISVEETNDNYFAKGNILYDKQQTEIISAGKIASSIVIPNSVERIAKYAFSENKNLNNLTFEGNTRIDDYSFRGCGNLKRINFNFLDKPRISLGAFVGSGIEELYVPYYLIGEYYSIFKGEISMYKSHKIKITLMQDNEVVGVVDSFYGSNVYVKNEPFKEGYLFDYWMDSEGNKFVNGDVWDKFEDFSVYANWTPQQAYVQFLVNDSLFGDKLATYDQPLGELPTPNFEGREFVCWRDQHGVYYDENSIFKNTSNLLLIAEFK